MSNKNHNIEIGDTVNGGTTDEDLDFGVVTDVDGNSITVQWEGSGETTTQDASVLTVE